MTTGWVKLYKKIFDHEIWRNPTDFRLFLLIIGKAVYEQEGKVMDGIHVGRGQWLRSYRMLQKDLEQREKRGYKQPGIATIKRSVERLVKMGLITVQETKNGTLFTVVNYEKYQGLPEDEDQLSERETVPDGINDGFRSVLDPVSGTDNGTKTEHEKPSNDEASDEQEKNNRNANGNEIGTTSERLRNKTKNTRSKEDKKDIYNTSSRRKRREYDEDSPYYKMALYFRKKIEENIPGYIFRGNMQTWADDFRKIHEIDKRTKEEIKAVIDWTVQDDFWQDNVQSPAKLRKQFHRLLNKMRKEQGGGANVDRQGDYGAGGTDQTTIPFNRGKYAGIGRRVGT